MIAQMKQMKLTPHSPATRQAAILISSHRPYAKAEALGRAQGHNVSRNALHRASTRPWHNSPRSNHAVLSFAAEDLVQALVNEGSGTASDLSLIEDWFTLIEYDALLAARPDDLALGRNDARFAENLIQQVTGESLMARLLGASARLHLARNPLTDAAAAQSLCHAATEALDGLIAEEAMMYQGADIEHLLSDADAYLSDFHADATGVLISTALHLQGQAKAAVSPLGWRGYAADLYRADLLPQMLIRGLFFREPQALINTAEAYWSVGETDVARQILRYTTLIDPDTRHWIDTIWAKWLNPGFLVLCQETLPQSRAQ